MLPLKINKSTYIVLKITVGLIVYSLPLGVKYILNDTTLGNTLEMYDTLLLKHSST